MGEEKKSFVSLGTVIMILAIAGFIFGGVSFYNYINGVRNVMVDKETQLNSQYLANQAYLSEYIGGFYEMLGVAGAKSEALDKVLYDSVKGRYDSSGGFKTPGGAMFSAIKEAYPDVSGLNIYDKIMDYVPAKRTGYRTNQEKTLDMLRSYDKWRTEDIIRSKVLKWFLDCPSESLVARIGTKKFIGKEAIEQMWVIVTTEGTAKAYETGTMKPLMGAPKAVPAPATK